jgi:hypothetical protein
MFCAAGCQTISQPDWTKNWFGLSQPRIKESKYAVPARMAILWSPAMLNDAGKAPVRGFGGRVYFYDSKNKPIAVEGQLVVYAYINEKSGGESKVPDRKFAFTPEQFTNHYSPTEMGASYSVWIPWDAVGEAQVDISLVPIFTSSSGALVMGQASRSLLPGPNTPQTSSSIVDATLPAVQINQSILTGDPTHREFAVQQAAFQQQPGANPNSGPLAPRVDNSGTANETAAIGTPSVQQQGGVSTMSITLPGTMADRLNQAPAQVTLMQKMAQLRQEAMAKQAGYTPPTLFTNTMGAPAPTTNSVTGQNVVGAVGQLPHQNAASGTPVTGPPAGAVIPPPWAPPPTPQPTRSALPSQPALGGRSLPQVAGPPPSQPFPGGPLSYLPGSPQLNPSSSGRVP